MLSLHSSRAQGREAAFLLDLDQSIFRLMPAKLGSKSGVLELAKRWEEADLGSQESLKKTKSEFRHRESNPGLLGESQLS